MGKRSIPLETVYQFLEPGPVVLVSTQYKEKADVMTMSWHMMVDFVPPLVACIISNRNYTFSLIKKTKECVINIPTQELAKKVVAIGNCSGKTLDKFSKFDVGHEAATTVQAPLLTECYVNLECKVVDASLANKYNMFILEVVKAWRRPRKAEARTIHHTGYGTFIVDGRKIKVPSKMP